MVGRTPLRSSQPIKTGGSSERIQFPALIRRHPQSATTVHPSLPNHAHCACVYDGRQTRDGEGGLNDGPQMTATRDAGLCLDVPLATLSYDLPRCHGFISPHGAASRPRKRSEATIDYASRAPNYDADEMRALGQAQKEGRSQA